VCRGQPLPGGEEHVENLALTARFLLQPLAQRLPLDELHGDEDVVPEGAHVVHRDYVRVREPRQGLRLT